MPYGKSKILTKIQNLSEFNNSWLSWCDAIGEQSVDQARMWTYFVHVMKSVNVRDLRNSFSMLEAWLSEGEDIRIE